MKEKSINCDYAVVGSGFGASVAALRLAQKGYDVLVLEQGKRWNPEDFPKTNWESKKYYWYPSLGCRGFFNMKLFKHVLVLRGIGVGGGSLVYGNTLFTPPDDFFESPEVRQLGGKKTLLPYYELAKKMMGNITNPRLYESDELLKKTAGDESVFMASPVGVFFNNTEESVKDPYFEGEGPDRCGCVGCGGCFVGCRYKAKNTLDLNYLFLAEKLGVTIYSETRVDLIKPLSEDGSAGYLLTAISEKNSTKERLSVRCKNLIVSAGVVGTVELLLKNKEASLLPNISEKLGHCIHTNNENLVGVRSRAKNKHRFYEGVAASSSVFPAPNTQIQVNHYSKGSDAIFMLTTLMTDKGRVPRWIKLLYQIIKRPADFLRTITPSGFAEETLLLVVMQTIQTEISMRLRRSFFLPWKKKLVSCGKNKAPAYIPIANDFARKLAEKMDGIPLNSLPETLLNVPATSHILGGCILGDNKKNSVVNYRNEVFGYKNFYICDASVIPMNLGVNPSLTILAFTELAMSRIPVKEGKKIRLLKVDIKWNTEELLCNPS